MTVINLVRTNKPIPSGEALEGARALLFGSMDGADQGSKKSWRRFWKRLVGMAAGEIAIAEMIIPRNGKYHRKFFAMLTVGFEAWEPARKRKTYKGRSMVKNFDQFREDVLIAAGFYEQTFDLRGRMALRAKSISFSNMDDAEFEKVYGAVADVLLADVLKTYAGRDELDEVVERVLSFV